MNFTFEKVSNIAFVLFILLSSYVLIKDISRDIDSIDSIKQEQEQIMLINTNNTLVLELQKERGLSVIYHANMSQVHKEKLRIQRRETFVYIKKSSSLALKKDIENFLQE